MCTQSFSWSWAMKLPDIHLLQAAIMLAEVRNYSRAARKLGIQQPTLTKRILELEHLIGTQLFLRSTQFVEPTDACRQLVEEAKQCIFHAERAVHLARVADHGAQAVLHIGKTQYTDPYLISVLKSLSLPLYPNLEVCLSSMSFAELETEVLLGKLDLALTTGRFENPKITQLELMRTPFYIALPEASTLAESTDITFAQLHQKTWLLFERSVHPQSYDSILQLAAEETVQPRLVHHVVTAEEAAQDLYAGHGDVAFLSRAGAWRIARNGITMRPLRHSDLAISAKLIARAADSSRLVSEFVRTLKRKLDTPSRLQLNLPLNDLKAS
jgi:DNA-binding transcriptional LysR family regulator